MDDRRTLTAELDWLTTPQGRRLLAAELREVRGALSGCFGDQLVQIGAWGGDGFIKLARTRRAVVTACAAEPGVGLISQGDNLPILGDSVDVVLLAHAVETHSDPHGLLREADRILRPGGHLVVLGFNPESLWGLRHLVSRRRFPPGVVHMIAERRLRDWLRLLSFSVQLQAAYHFQLPLAPGVRRGGSANGTGGARPRRTVTTRVGRLARRIRTWPPFAACYLLVARKEMYTATAIRPTWRRRPRLVGGLVNPTTRNAA